MNILILGGNRFFGKKLATKLVQENHQLTILNRGHLNDGLGHFVKRLICDRKNNTDLKKVIADKSWDVIIDQICYDAEDAQAACELFSDKCHHYIFTSSQSVYHSGANLIESDFEAKKYQFNHIIKSSENYAEAKRQCEHIFATKMKAPLTMVRFPIVLGTDDYTERLKFHIQRIREQKPIFFPNLEAKISFINSDDASHVLKFLISTPGAGAINAASAIPIGLKDLITTIESFLGQNANLAHTSDLGEKSPFGIEQDWYLNAEKLTTLGIKCSPLDQWLRPLIAQY